MVLYNTCDDVTAIAARATHDADAVIITSSCPDALSAAELALDNAHGIRVSYDLDTPVALARLGRRESRLISLRAGSRISTWS
jgi:hypothetical protein